MSDTEHAKQESNDSQSIGERVREHLPVGLMLLERRARAQWISIPNQLRSAVDDLLARIRRGLDLPSRADIDELLTRIDDLDHKLALLEAARAARAAQAAEPPPKRRTKAAKPKAAKAPAKTRAKSPAKPKAAVASKDARRAAIERAAQKQSD